MADLTIKVRHQLPLDLVRERLRGLIPDLRRALQAGDPDVKVDVDFGQNAGSFSRQGLDGDITLLPDAVAVTATELYVLTREKYNQVTAMHKQLAVDLANALTRTMAMRLRRAEGRRGRRLRGARLSAEAHQRRRAGRQIRAPLARAIATRNGSPCLSA